MKGFKNVLAYVDGKGVINCDIAVENGVIKEIGTKLDITEPFPYRDGDVVLPGFIDEHIHGADGVDVMDGTVDALSVVSKALAREGTTSFLATTMTQSRDNILKALSAIKTYMDMAKQPNDCDGGAEILGVHLEGPFISEKHIGAQPLKYLSDPKPQVFDEYFAASGNSVKLVTLAPEEHGADELLRALTAKGVHPSAGHSDAGYNDIKAAIQNGLDCVTHTFNAQRGIHHREIGVAGSALLEDELYAEAICDLIHLSAPAIKLLVKNKPKDKLILITDSMRAKNLPDGESEIGGQKVIVKNGEARLENGALAGSTLKMNDALKNLVLKLDVPFTQAVNYATANPAKHLGVFDRKGSIKAGKDADFCVLTCEFDVETTITRGKITYRNTL